MTNIYSILYVFFSIFYLCHFITWQIYDVDIFHLNRFQNYVVPFIRGINMRCILHWHCILQSGRFINFTRLQRTHETVHRLHGQSRNREHRFIIDPNIARNISLHAGIPNVHFPRNYTIPS